MDERTVIWCANLGFILRPTLSFRGRARFSNRSSPFHDITLAQLGIDPKVDFAFKKLFGSRDHPDITIHFLNSVLGGDPLIKSVEILNPFNEKDFEDDKLSILDVKATDDQGRLLDIEMQTSLPGELANRLIYYAASQYVTQLREGARYVNLLPSIGISVLDGILFSDVPDLPPGLSTTQ